MTDKPRIKMYATETCSYCLAARMLLKKKGLEFEDVLLSTNAGLHDEMLRLTGRRTVPQILIDDTAIGGFDDLYQLEQTGELDRMLEAENSASSD